MKQFGIRDKINNQRMNTQYYLHFCFVIKKKLLTSWASIQSFKRFMKRVKYLRKSWDFASIRSPRSLSSGWSGSPRKRAATASMHAWSRSRQHPVISYCMYMLSRKGTALSIVAFSFCGKSLIPNKYNIYVHLILYSLTKRDSTIGEWYYLFQHLYDAYHNTDVYCQSNFWYTIKTQIHYSFYLKKKRNQNVNKYHYKKKKVN